MAETPRFELGVRRKPYDALARRWIKPLSHVSVKNGGGIGIRTPGGRKPTAVFKTAAFDRSAIPPKP